MSSQKVTLPSGRTFVRQDPFPDLWYEVVPDSSEPDGERHELIAYPNESVLARLTYAVLDQLAVEQEDARAGGRP